MISMTMRALCVLCVVVSWAFHEGVVQAAPAGQKPAEEDDVNVLMYGVLQFGDAMRHTFQSTEAKLARLLAAVRKTEGLVRQVDQQTLEAKEAEIQIKEGIHYLQAQTADLKSSTEEAKGKVQEVQQEDLEMKTKLKALESTLKTADPDSFKSLKATVERNSRLLSDLLDWTQHQKKTMQIQKQQLVDLQKQKKS